MFLMCGNSIIKLDECNSFRKRLIGFMFYKKKITIGKRFIKCNSIHTFFMMQKIDVIMTDKNNKILKIYGSLKPNRIILPKRKVYYTYELPLNTSKNYKIGNILTIKKA